MGEPPEAGLGFMSGFLLRLRAIGAASVPPPSAYHGVCLHMERWLNELRLAWQVKSSGLRHCLLEHGLFCSLSVSSHGEWWWHCWRNADAHIQIASNVDMFACTCPCLFVSARTCTSSCLSKDARIQSMLAPAPAAPTPTAVPACAWLVSPAKYIQRAASVHCMLS